MGIFTIIVIPLCLVRKLHKLAFTHLIADLFMICALGYYLVISSIKVGEEGLAEGVEPANPQLCLMMIGMAIFSYEGFAMVLPIKEAMKDTKNFPYLVTAMMITCTSLLCAFGLLNYLAYGKSTEIIITLNYEKSYVTTGVLLLYVLSIILTYPMTLVPINIIIEQTLDMKLEWTYVSRIILVLCSVSSAIVLNDSADKYLSVLGAVFCAPVGFILPSLMYLYGVPHLSFFNKFMGVFMIVFGLASGSLATFVAIYNW